MLSVMSFTSKLSSPTPQRVNDGRMKDKKTKIMKQKLYEILLKYKCNEESTYGAMNQILSLLAENTEVVSDAQDKSAVYTHVGECNAERSDGNQDGRASVAGALEKITDDGSDFIVCYDHFMTSERLPKCKDQCKPCKDANNKIKKSS